MSPIIRQQSRSTRPLWQRMLLLLAFGGLAGTLVVVAIAVIASLIFFQAISRLDVDDRAVATFIEYSVELTLREGTDQQRLDLMVELEQIGPPAKPFVPALLEAADDPDPAIREAAVRALRRIDPESLDASEPM